MIETETPKTQAIPTETAGSDFVKKIGILGCIMFMMMFVLYLIMCFAPKASLLENYTPPQASEYYADHLEELEIELMENVFPRLSDKITCELGEDVIKIYIPAENFWDFRSAILDHFDPKLFEFSEFTQE